MEQISRKCKKLLTFCKGVLYYKCKNYFILGGVIMKDLLKKLGFRKMDEMEREIVFKAQRNAYYFLIAALFVWTLYESYLVYTEHTQLNLIPCMLLIAASLIQTFSQLLMTRNAVKDDEDSFETGPLLKIIFLVIVVVGVIVTIGVAFLTMGVRL